MKKLVLSVALILIEAAVFGSSDSVFIDIGQLRYSSEFEKLQFNELSKKNSFNALHFLFCLDSTTTSVKAEKLKAKLNTFFESKFPAGSTNKNTDKTIKSIFKEIHDKYKGPRILPVVALERTGGDGKL